MFGLGFGELILIFLIALIFIGPKKLPELAKGLGQGLKEFQKAAKGFSEQMHESVKEDQPSGITHNLIEPTEPLETVNASHNVTPEVATDSVKPKDPSHS